MLGSLFNKTPYPAHTPINPPSITPGYANVKRVNPAQPARNKTAKNLNQKSNKEVINTTDNPINIIKDLIETELVGNVKLIKFHERLNKVPFDDKFLKNRLSISFKELLFNFIKNAKLPLSLSNECGEGIKFINGFTFMFTNSDNDKHIPLVVGLYFDNADFPNGKIQTFKSTLFDIRDFKKRFPKINDPEYYIGNDAYKRTLSKIVKLFELPLGTEPSQFEILKYEFSECKNTYYVVPVMYYQSVGDVKGTGGHANLLLLDKFNERAIWIEPQMYGKADLSLMNSQINEKKEFMSVILGRLGLSNYEQVVPVTHYPQSITDDTNCTFWTFLITVTYLLNPGVNSPDEVAKAILKKYPTKEELINYIEGFKEKLDKYLSAFSDITGRPYGGRKHRKRSSKTKRRII